MKVAIAAFAKTPDYSSVKTRLAETRGAAFAESFYVRSVRAVEAVLEDLCMSVEIDVSAYWAVAEEDAVGASIWSKFPAIWTGEGGLGQRLASVQARLFEQHDAVILIGTDSPQLPAQLFLQALQILEEHPEECVIGPAYDGGFYLFASRFAVSPEIWNAVGYSEETTRQQLVEKLSSAGIACCEMQSEIDADTEEALAVLLTVLSDRSDHLLPAQKELQDWLEEEMA